MKSVVALLLVPITAMAAVPVTIAPLSDLLTAVERTAPASVVPLNRAALSAEITAKVERIDVRVGDRVEPGAVLVKLDCRYYATQLAAAKAERRRLESQRLFAAQQLRRAQDLSRQRSISEELLGQRVSELNGLLAQLGVQEQLIRQAEIQTERCIVRAPYRGAVTERAASIGELADPGTPLLRLVQLDELEVNAELAEAELASLDHAHEIGFRFSGADYPLRLRRLLPVIDERRRTRNARLQFIGPGAPVGAAGRLTWRGAPDHIPTGLLVRRGENLGIFLAADGKAKFHTVRGAIEGQPAPVDLPPDSQVVVEGQQSINDGDDITVAPQGTP